jgi:RNA polymerase sigma factor (sigma-70 family)
MEKKSETDQLIYRAAEILKDLSSDERNLLQRFYIEDQSLKTIADELGISEGAVRKRKFDVLKKLSKKISGGFLSFTGTL